MRRLAAVAASFVLAAQSAQALSVSTDPKQAPAGVYQIDPRHTQVLFAIPHFGITNYYGRFDKTSGTLNFNPNDPAASAVSVTLDTTSIDTPSQELTGELQSQPVFDTAHFPQATFKSTAAVRTGPNTGTVTGDLTIKGITKSVTFDVTYNGGLQSPIGNAFDIGFHGTATIKRSDFDMTSMMWAPIVGDDVQLTIEALFQQTKE
jgi:polyisoprenoid-binding protein YceI